MPRLLFSLLLVGLLLAPASGSAASDSDLSVARQLFEQGRLHQEREQWAEASSLYKQAIEIKDTPGLRYRLGYCEQKQGHLVEAKLEFQRAKRLLESGVHAPDVAELLPAALDELDKLIPRVQISVAGKPNGLALELDGRKLASQSLDAPIPLNPGSHTIRLTAPEHEPASERFVLSEGEQRSLEVSLRPAQTVGSTRDSTVSKRAGPSTAKVIVLASEAALIAGGLSLGIAYAQKRKDAENRVNRLNAELDQQQGTNEKSCNNPSGDLAALCDQLKRATNQRREADVTSNVAFITAGLATTAALITYLVWSDTGSAQVGLSVAPGESALWLSGSF